MSRHDDPLGRRSLFSAPYEREADRDLPPAGADMGAGGGSAGAGSSGGRRAMFSAPQVSGRSVVVTCRNCRARTPLSLSDVIRRLLPSVWWPLRPWSRWMRCPSCCRFSWCRVEWSHLISPGDWRR
ncbi:MAG: hypothetical protein M3137_06165 [Actinomycetota bacterium]|nr:hypothetical protein [Actinomycetota bacterium]